MGNSVLSASAANPTVGSGWLGGGRIAGRQYGCSIPNRPRNRESQNKIFIGDIVANGGDSFKTGMDRDGLAYQYLLTVANSCPTEVFEGCGTLRFGAVRCGISGQGVESEEKCAGGCCPLAELATLAASLQAKTHLGPICHTGGDGWGMDKPGTQFSRKTASNV